MKRVAPQGVRTQLLEKQVHLLKESHGSIRTAWCRIAGQAARSLPSGRNQQNPQPVRSRRFASAATLHADLKAFALVVTSLCLATTAQAQVTFIDTTKEAGIDWVHKNGATPERYLIETMGGGAAFLDYDNDGLFDIYLVNSGSHARSTSPSTVTNALYRNQGDGTFKNVTEQAGVAGGGYGMGVAVADYDNDGWSDIYVTNFGPNVLYRNRGDGSFENRTAQAGVSVDKWSSSAAFFDLDNDGDLDLFVCVYLDWNYEKNIYCGDKAEGQRSYCHPTYFGGISSVLFENQGDGTFQDISEKAGVHIEAKALGVVTGDVDDDGDADLYVANDTLANHLYINNGDRTFEEIGLMAEVAYGSAVKPESGMGTDLGDFDGDGRLDLIVTNIDYEMNNLYRNAGDGFFDDVTIRTGLGQVALPYSGFGVRFLDYDNDGDLDLSILNGHVIPNIAHYKSNIEYAEPPLLLENREGKFVDVSENSGEVFQRKLVGRSLASADFDNDGDPDLLVVSNDSPAVLLRNDGGDRGHWIGLHLVGSRGNRDAVGARVIVSTDQRRLVRERTGGGSYQAAHDPRLLFGLLEGEKIESVEIRWPGGPAQTIEPPRIRTYTTVTESSR